MWTFIVVFVLLTAGLRAQDYDNSLRGILRHACPDNQVVSQIKSSYSSTEQDRQWKIECKAFNNTSDCSWSSYQDASEKELSYNCPANHVVAGVYSDYNSQQGGRRWKFLCCSSPNLITFECRKTPMVNYLSEDFNWQLPAGHFLTGVQTHFRNDTNRDHRWSFNYCKGKTQDTQTVNSQILTANKPISDHLIEGDVFVSNARNARICDNCKWPKLSQTVKVPYVISDSFTSHEKLKIENAISAFHMSTCIRFVARTSQIDYISIVKQNGCWSWVGRTGRSQQLSLDTGCIHNGIIQHELIHVLGFWHEQSRSDRDAFVRINYENVLEGQESNFRQLETNNLNVPYDYTSVMHYAPKDFSKNAGDTVIPLDPSAQIGQSEGMSENDILKINRLYVCSKSDFLHAHGEWDNTLDNDFSRVCPSGQAVSGITRWRFYCCSTPGFTTSNCQTATDINYYKEYFSWTVASDHFLTGVKSSFDDNSRDRRWSLTYCQGNSQ
ncbi:zinc metalloproteinase nas-33-like [Anoplopoma fimbria]|uniref:zinc metalloproteinase nas-33-like n=1 Tax=Anoplopoma fimbria TaxID=229290 RepID=UPI0023ED7109|nr:zinc metalloproteinase nas-33-like [Anoplopoma fimbria]